MIAQPSPHDMSVDEWRELERVSHNTKHEYIDGHVYALSGGSLTHSSIGSNVVRVLQDALRSAGKSCYTYNSDVAARLSSSRYTYPDASVTCDEGDKPTPDKTEIQSPCVIVEVLSDSTEAYDRGKKLSYYRACPTVEEYVLVASKEQAVDVYRRTQHSWTYDSYGPGDEIELTSLSIRVSVATFYRDAGVPASMDNSEGEI
jgi:Uma2 family endonuclease